MKTIAYLLAFYLVLLTFVPCVDVSNEGTCPQVEQSDSQHHLEHTDSCSPFCHCNCCAVSVVLSTIYALKYFHRATYKTEFLFKNQFISSNFSSIWQPPKI